IPCRRDPFAAQVDEPHHAIAARIEHGTIERATIGRAESSSEDAGELLVRIDGEHRDAVTVEGAAAERDRGAPAVRADLDDTSVAHRAGEVVEHLRLLEGDHALGAVEAVAQAPRGALRGPCGCPAPGRAFDLPSPPEEYAVEPLSQSSFPPLPARRGCPRRR